MNRSRDKNEDKKMIQVNNVREESGEHVPKVSVIIPFHNAQSHLEEMMDSVEAQTFREIEILCVSDGSEDDSIKIIRERMEKDPRIHLIEQEKHNAGVARNKGLECAVGKYVVFWDADDRFHPKALEELYHKSEQVQADICVCEVCEFRGDGKLYETGGYLQKDKLPEKDPFNKYDIPGDIFGFASNMLWNKMLRRAFIVGNEITFQDIRQGNDTAFVMQAMYQAERITTVSKELAYYRMNNPGSLTSQASETWKCPFESYRYTWEQLKKQDDFALVEKSFRNKMIRGLFRSLNIQTSFAAYQELYDFLKEEGMRAVDLEDVTEDMVEEPWMYADLMRMKSMSAGDFLLCKATERMNDRDQLKYTLRRVRRRLAFLLALNEKIKRLKKKIKWKSKKSIDEEGNR